MCPNGGDTCKYRHALPPGYVFKTKKQRELEAAAKAEAGEEEVDICEAIEAERARLPTAGQVKVTAETFKAWKEARDKRKVEAMKTKQEEEAKKGQASGRAFAVLSGRALFTYDPSLFVDDADADVDVYSDQSDEEGEEEAAARAAEGGSNAAAGGGVVVGDASAFLEGGGEADVEGLDDLEDEEGEGEGEGGGEEEEEEGEGEKS